MSRAEVAQIVKGQVPQPGGFLGTVDTTPTDAGERLTVILDAFSDKPYPALWPSYLPEDQWPSEGDTCLVVFAGDDQGTETFVPMWWPGG